MNIVVMGCGRVGARLAQLFESEGHQVAIIDLKAESFARLDAQFKGTTIAGTGIDEDVLKSAGIRQADVFLAVTNQDNANLMAAQIAKLTFQVPRVIARIYDPDREGIFHEMGMETICPTALISNGIYEAVNTGAHAHIPGVQPRLPAVAPAGERPELAPVGPRPRNGAAPGTTALDADRPAGHLGQSLRQRFFR